MRIVVDPETFDAIIADITGGLSAHKAIKAHGVSNGSFYRAVDSDAICAEKYARARISGLDCIADEIIDLADDSPPDAAWTNKARLQVDARRWLLSKLAPKRYGDATTIRGDPDAPLQAKVSVVYDTPTGSVSLPETGKG